MVGNIGKEEGDVGVDTASEDVHIFNQIEYLSEHSVDHLPSRLRSNSELAPREHWVTTIETRKAPFSAMFSSERCPSVCMI